MTMLKAITALSVLLTLGFAGSAAAGVSTGGLYDFTGSQYADDFTDLRRGGDIDSDHDVGGTGHSALNFTARPGRRGTPGSRGGRPAARSPASTRAAARRSLPTS